MEKCLNCAEPAHYVVENPGASTQHFCVSHLPRFMNPKKLNDHVKLYKPGAAPADLVVEPVAEASATTPAPVKTKKKAAAKAEPVVEETPAVEETTVEPVVEEVPVEE